MNNDEEHATSQNVNTLWSNLDNLFRASLTQLNATKNKQRFNELSKELGFNPHQTQLLFESLSTFNNVRRSSFYTNQHSIINDNASSTHSTPKRYAIPTNANQPIAGNMRKREYASDSDLSSSPEPLMQSASKPRRKVGAKRKKKAKNINLSVSEEDQHKICEIISELGLGEDMNIGVRIYGYSDHLAVYEDLSNLVKNFDEEQQKNYLEQQSSMRLRDIKAKIRSTGRYSSKQEMMDGVCDKLKELNVYYQNKQ